MYHRLLRPKEAVGIGGQVKYSLRILNVSLTV